MTTAIIKFTATAELNLDSDTFPRGMTNEEKLAYWLEGAKREPLLALAAVEAKWDMEALDSVFMLKDGDKLYATPIPPADVAELQSEIFDHKRMIENEMRKSFELMNENSDMKEECTALRMGWDEASRENAELTRKLAEQQALFIKAASTDKPLNYWVGKDGSEELAKLLEEAKRQAVPEGWKLVPVEPTGAMVQIGRAQFYHTPESHWKAMLSAAPSPLATPEERKE